MRAQDFAAHAPDQVLNQVPPLADYNLFEFDTPLQEALAREGGAWAADDISAFGAELGRTEMLHAADLANTYLPELENWDRFGNRIDQVRFHDAWHTLMDSAVSRGIHSLPWTSKQAGAHVARAGYSHLKHQIEQGTSCPLTMTFAVVPSLRMQPSLADVWIPRATSNEYDSRFLPAQEKRGVLFGMAMTERQGGSDVRANTTRAVPIDAAGPGENYRLNGHKWFCSAPMCDAFLVLAQTKSGLSCFLLPRHLPDGTVNAGFRVNRLKNKLGNKSNASSEVEFHNAWATMVGDEGRGVATILEMVRHTRLDCTLGGASLIRRCVAEALHHCNHRFAFGKRLIEQPLMKNVLADMCLESEAATAMSLRLARAFDQAPTEPSAARFARLGTAIAKYYICKQESEIAREAMECHGGNGFVETAPMARLYRESPLNSIWEGSGNVQCLDVLRAIRRDPETLGVIFAELEGARGGNDHFDDALDGLTTDMNDLRDAEVRARHLVERFAKLLQASVLVQHAPTTVSEAYCASRLAGNHGHFFGTLDANVDFDSIIARSCPEVG